MRFQHGSLVSAREREWVVLPDSSDKVLILRPIDGTDDQITGISTDLEEIVAASFPPPKPEQAKDFGHCALLRDAVRLGTRHGAGPFRCLSRISVEPRSYQLVPLMMALKLDPVRMLIADDVGIGKTIESGLIARELFDRGEIKRFTVLCPPAIAEQWQLELNTHFEIEAELVLPGTAARLEKRCRAGKSLFEEFPFTVVSLDYIKSERHRSDFIRACPEFVIVDEAHTCTFGYQKGAGRHQRFDLVSELSKDKKRHLILVTATPHSGKDDNFSSLLGLLHEDFGRHIGDSETEQSAFVKQLSKHIVQRKRSDIYHYLREDTIFPDREEASKQSCYNFSAKYGEYFDKVLEYANTAFSVSGTSEYHRRLMWWSALALLRSVVSSPAAAIATMRNRSFSSKEQSEKELDDAGSALILDLSPDESAELPDSPAGVDADDTADNCFPRSILNRLAKEAEELMGANDYKLQRAKKIVRELLDEKFNPILFCRFIHTAEYVANELKRELKNDYPNLDVVCITGTLPPEQRKKCIEELDDMKQRLLVCTECLSEGINLQYYFDAVVHYDLSWNPTRHEQREGRVDRFGQPKRKIRVVTFYGNNPVDGAIIETLIQKHNKIRKATGISVPIPIETNLVVQAIMKSVRLKRGWQPGLFDSIETPDSVKSLHLEWDESVKREVKSRSLYAQHSIKADEVEQEVKQARASLGTKEEVKSFIASSFQLHNAAILGNNGTMRVSLKLVSQALLDAIGLEQKDSITFKFEPPSTKSAKYISRSSPLLRELSAYIVNSSLNGGAAGRIGAIRTDSVTIRTTLLLYRFRFNLTLTRQEESYSTLVEDTALLGFEGSPESQNWLNEQAVLTLAKQVKPSDNLKEDFVRMSVKLIADNLQLLYPHIEGVAKQKAEEINLSHQRVRKAAQMKGVEYSVSPHMPPDLIGLYVMLPGGGAR